MVSWNDEYYEGNGRNYPDPEYVWSGMRPTGGAVSWMDEDYEGNGVNYEEEDYEGNGYCTDFQKGGRRKRQLGGASSSQEDVRNSFSERMKCLSQAYRSYKRRLPNGRYTWQDFVQGRVQTAATKCKIPRCFKDHKALKLSQLKVLARRAGIRGYSSMTKPQLCAVLKKIGKVDKVETDLF